MGVIADQTMMPAQHSDASLQEFLGRPIRVASLEWPVGGEFDLSFSPWKLFFDDPRVINRISNYNLMRTRLGVKFVINGNGFYFGRVICSYIYRPDLYPFGDLIVPATGPDLAFGNYQFEYGNDRANCQLSQCPHVYLNPTTNMGGELLLPFFWHENAFHIPSANWSDAGMIHLKSMSNLRHVNDDGARPVTISIFVWALDTDLSAPTSYNPSNIVSQSGGPTIATTEALKRLRECEEFLTQHTPEDGRELLSIIQDYRRRITAIARNNPIGYGTVPSHLCESPNESQSGDEYGRKPISDTATGIATAASLASNIPVIGPYAQATSMVASTVADIARAFGFSRPPTLDDIHAYAPRVLGDLATTSTTDTSQVLALDPKQELTIDPRTVGLPATDELAMMNIARRESWFADVTWATTDEADTCLFSTNVCPVQYESAGVNKLLYFPPVAWMSQLFTSWTGSLEFRFMVCGADSHKGRLRLVWDPNGPPDANSFNTNFQQIVDIAVTDDFTVKVGWGNQRTFLSVPEVLIAGGGARSYEPSAMDPTEYFGNEFSNGVLSMYVLNDLTTANFTTQSNLKIQIFVRACEDFRLMDPTSKILGSFSYYPPDNSCNLIGDYSHIVSQGGAPDDAHGATTSASKQAAPLAHGSDTLHLGPTPIDHTRTHLVWAGESFTSLRQLLKRYCYVDALPLEDFNVELLGWCMSCIPPQRGAPPTHGSVILTGGTDNKHANKMTHLNYIMGPFTGYRGGTRWKHMLDYTQNSDVNHVISSMFVNRETVDLITPFRFVASTPLEDITSTYLSHMARSPLGFEGMAGTASDVNPVVETQFPYYRPYRFSPAATADYADKFHEKYAVRVRRKGDSSVLGTSYVIHRFVSVAEDFTLFGFRFIPPVYRYNIQTAS